MGPADRVHVSADWLARLRASAAEDPWVHGFSLVHRETGAAVGRCGFKGPPDADALVPEKFKAVRISRLPGGEPAPDCIRRLQELSSGRRS